MFFLCWISVIWLVLVVVVVLFFCRGRLWNPGIFAVVSRTLCALGKKLENVVRANPATSSQGQICHPQVVGLRRKSWWMGRATYYWSEMKEDLRSSRWVNHSDIKKKKHKTKAMPPNLSWSREMHHAGNCLQTVVQTARRQNITSPQDCLELCDSTPRLFSQKHLRGGHRSMSWPSRNRFLWSKGQRSP